MGCRHTRTRKVGRIHKTASLSRREKVLCCTYTLNHYIPPKHAHMIPTRPKTKRPPVEREGKQNTRRAVPPPTPKGKAQARGAKKETNEGEDTATQKRMCVPLFHTHFLLPSSFAVHVGRVPKGARHLQVPAHHRDVARVQLQHFPSFSSILVHGPLDKVSPKGPSSPA